MTLRERLGLATPATAERLERERRERETPRPVDDRPEWIRRRDSIGLRPKELTR